MAPLYCHHCCKTMHYAGVVQQLPRSARPPAISPGQRDFSSWPHPLESWSALCPPVPTSADNSFRIDPGR
jgi:hypothetical protein